MAEGCIVAKGLAHESFAVLSYSTCTARDAGRVAHGIDAQVPVDILCGVRPLGILPVIVCRPVLAPYVVLARDACAVWTLCSVL